MKTAETATDPKTIPPAVFKNGREVICKYRPYIKCIMCVNKLEKYNTSYSSVCFLCALSGTNKFLLGYNWASKSQISFVMISNLVSYVSLGKSSICAFVLQLYPVTANKRYQSLLGRQR